MLAVVQAELGRVDLLLRRLVHGIAADAVAIAVHRELDRRVGVVGEAIEICLQAGLAARWSARRQHGVKSTKPVDVVNRRSQRRVIISPFVRVRSLALRMSRHRLRAAVRRQTVASALEARLDSRPGHSPRPVLLHAPDMALAEWIDTSRRSFDTDTARPPRSPLRDHSDPLEAVLCPVCRRCRILATVSRTRAATRTPPPSLRAAPRGAHAASEPAAPAADQLPRPSASRSPTSSIACSPRKTVRDIQILTEQARRGRRRRHGRHARRRSSTDSRRGVPEAILGVVRSDRHRARGRRARSSAPATIGPAIRNAAISALGSTQSQARREAPARARRQERRSRRRPLRSPRSAARYRQAPSRR